MDNWGQFILIFPQKGQMVNLFQNSVCWDAGIQESSELSATLSQCVYLGPVHWQCSNTCTLVTTPYFFSAPNQDGSVDTEVSDFWVHGAKTIVHEKNIFFIASKHEEYRFLAKSDVLEDLSI